MSDASTSFLLAFIFWEIAGLRANEGDKLRTVGAMILALLCFARGLVEAFS